MNTFIPMGGSGRVRVFAPASLAALFLILSFNAFGQTSCTVNSTTPAIHAEGLAERIGDLTVRCAGAMSGSTVSLYLYITLNTTITNRLDVNGNLTGISVTPNPVMATVPTPQLNSTSTTLAFNGLSYVASASPETIVISGIRAAAGAVANGTGAPLITASVVGVGAQFSINPQLPVAISSLTLLDSTLNGGIPCQGSPLPATIDFPSFIAAQSTFSTVRITEASVNSFTPKSLDPTADTGLRILVKLAGYTAGSQVFVPDAIVGNDPGVILTSAGSFNATVSAGNYTPGTNTLLLLRVAGADATGTGGALAIPVPTTATAFSTVTQINLTNGAGYAVYEVVDANPGIRESAQIPVFLAAPQTACTGTIPVPALTAMIAPVSSVSVPTATDPIPRFIATIPGSDCQLVGDCSASYFPNFTVDTTAINLSAASMGNRQGAYIAVGNSGGGFVNFTAAVAYQSGTGWLTVTPTNGQNNVSLQVFADPTSLQPGTYNATVTVTAGTNCVATTVPACMFTVPVTFVVGPVGVTIQNVLNAASGTGPIAPGSYVALYGLNLTGTKVGVTFNSLPGTVIYSNATQINVIVPASLGNQTAADVVATVDGRVSNSFKVSLALNAPGIFSNGIVNFADGAGNTAADPVARGSFAIVYLTGLTTPLTGQVTVNIGSQTNLIPAFAGAQGEAALDQVNIVVPAILPATPSPIPLTVCIPGPVGTPVCSNAVNLYIK